jgi:GTPase SAR1 family protein
MSPTQTSQTLSASVSPPAYADFRRKQTVLQELVKQTAAAFDRLGQRSWRDSLLNLNDKIASDLFRVMVVGNFKSGKSTFINALLGQPVLPAYSIPCTAVINEVKWGAQKKATLHFRNPVPLPLPEGLAPGAAAHIERAAGAHPRPMDIPVEDLEIHVVIPDPSKPQEESVSETPYERVELFWPLPLCENRVEIIDSPGLNEHGIRERVTTDYLSKADAVIFVLTCLSLASQREMDFVDTNIRPAGHDDLFFVCNRYDQLGSSKEQERVRDYGMKKLLPKTQLGDRGIHFVSALKALDGRVAGDSAQVQASGMIPMEKALADFLVTQRGKVKILQPARELKRACAELANKILPSERGLIELGSEELERKYRAVTPKLDALRREREQILKQIDYHREILVRDVKHEFVTQLQRIIDELPSQSAAMQTQASIEVLALNHKRLVEDLLNEMSGKLEGVIQAGINTWRTTVLAPLMEKRMQALSKDLEKYVEQFYAKVDDINTDFSAGVRSTGNVDEISGSHRFFASLTGFLVGDLYSGLHGARFGFEGLLPAVGTQIALVIGMAILGVTNPWIIIPVLLGGGAFNAFLNAEKMTGKVKRMVGEEMAKKLGEQIVPLTEKVCTKVGEKVGLISSAASATLERDIQSIEEQVNAARAALEAGEQELKVKRATLESVEKEIADINSRLDDLIFSVA